MDLSRAIPASLSYRKLKKSLLLAFEIESNIMICMQSKTSSCITVCHELQILVFKIQCHMITCGPSLSFMQQCEKSLLEWRNVWLISHEEHPSYLSTNGVPPPTLPPPPGQPLFQQLDISQIKLKVIDGS